MAIISYPPVFRYKPTGLVKPSLFLAGSIEMGLAFDWQAKVCEQLDKAMSIIFNPRREGWDTSWKQSIDEPNFNAQVTWEMQMIEQADLVMIYLDPETKSPITLAELGLVAAMKPSQVHLCCPEGFWRKGNVDMICERYGIRTYETMPAMITGLQTAAVGFVGSNPNTGRG